MKPARKRKTIIKDENSNITKNADAIILKYLKSNKNCEFGDLFRYVNNELGKNNEYRRRGFSLRLNKLISERKVGRRKYKQGHFLYYLTKRGEENIELISMIFRDFASSLLRSHFPKKKSRISKEHYVQRMVERIGIYMLYSYIYGIQQYTSPTKNLEKNLSNLEEWETGINPSAELGKYIMDVSRNFIKFDNEQDMIVTESIEKESFFDIIQDFQKILEKKYPEEFEHMESSVRFLPWKIDDGRLNNLTTTERMKETLEVTKRKL